MPGTENIKGRAVHVWEKSFSIDNKDNQEYHITGVLFVNAKPKTEMIKQFCEALDSAYEAGKKSAKKELRTWLGL